MLCPSCRHEITETDAKKCPYCGSELQNNAFTFNQEEIVAAIPNSVGIHGGINPYYDLYFTNRRVVVINLGKRKAAAQAIGVVTGGALGGALGAVIGLSIQQKLDNSTAKRQENIQFSLDERVSKNKDSFSAAFENIDSIKLKHQSRFLHGTPRAAEIGFRVPSRKIIFGLSEQQYDFLSARLSQISALTEKLHIQ